MRWDLVIFDCDGVLVDSERIAVRIDARVVTELGWPLTEAEIVERFMGRSDAYMVSEIERRLPGLPAGWNERFASEYEAAFEAELAPVDGVVAALDAIATPTCVASSGTHARIRRSLALTDLRGRFPEGRIFSVEDVTEGKPAPDLFLHAADALGADPARCAVVEDSVYGVEAARAAGMTAFGYAGGLTAAHRLAGPATVVFDDMRRLPGLLEANAARPARGS